MEGSQSTNWGRPGAYSSLNKIKQNVVKQEMDEARHEMLRQALPELKRLAAFKDIDQLDPEALSALADHLNQLGLHKSDPLIDQLDYLAQARRTPYHQRGSWAPTFAEFKKTIADWDRLLSGAF